MLSMFNHKVLLARPARSLYIAFHETGVFMLGGKIQARQISGGEQISGFRSSAAVLLAVAATGTAICMSVLAGWQRGGWLAERLVWCAISVVLVLCVHLLPALCRTSSFTVRCIAAALWVGCAIAVGFSHATFFLLSQQHAGDRRAGAIIAPAEPVPSVTPPVRNLTAIAGEEAKVRAVLGVIDARRCERNCANVHARRVALSAKVDALVVEANEARRWEMATDRRAAQESHVTALRDSARDDPVMARLATCLGMTEGSIDLPFALVLAAGLEGVACLCCSLYCGPESRFACPSISLPFRPSQRKSRPVCPGVTSHPSSVTKPRAGPP
jgi:hypothetical protein